MAGVFLVGLSTAWAGPSKTAGKKIVRTAASPGPAKPSRARQPIARSVGAPNAGRLENGAKLEPTPAMRFLDAYDNTAAHYALPQLVGLLDRASRRVQKRFPGAVLGLGHLSNPRGGSINRHASHESGRDADVAFYAVDAQKRSVLLPTLTSFGSDGRAQGHRGVVFDDARNFELIAALLNDGQTRVNYLFVAPFIRARLLEYGKTHGASAGLLTRMRQTLVQPKFASLHDDHVHVRIGCPSGMSECTERPEPRKRGRIATVAKSKGGGAAPRSFKPNRPAPVTRNGSPVAEKNSSGKSTSPPKVPASKPGKIIPLPPDEDEPEGLDRLIGPRVEGLDSIVVPGKRLQRVDDTLDDD